MSEKFSKDAKRKKPQKPHPDFPLTAHNSGQWSKKIRQRVYYFGKWDNPQAALERFLAVKDDLLAGRTPRPHDPDALTLERLCDLFCENRERRVKTGELADRTFVDYVATAKKLVAILGRNVCVEQLRPDDFSKLRAKLAEGVNLKTLEGEIARVRAVFNYADKNGLLEVSLSKLWGVEFGKPSRTALTKLRNKQERLFTPQEVRTLLDASQGAVKAMILLGINGGLGPTDISVITEGDFCDGWLSLPRQKTGKPRRVPLWPQTIEAVEIAKQRRPTPKDDAHADLLFVTKYGQAWTPTRTRNPLSLEFRKLLERCGLYEKGRTSFYTLRHVFQTVADEAGDFVAVSAIMGHAPQSISDHYREKVSEARLRAVVDHVAEWLFAEVVQ